MRGHQRKHQTEVHTESIRVLQVNANRSNDVMHAALNAAAGVYDVVLFQEPWWGEIANNQIGSVGHQSFQVLPPMLPIPDDSIPRVLAYTVRREDFYLLSRTDIAQDLDFQLLEVKQGDYPPVLIVNVYNQESEGGGWTFDRLREVPIPDDIPVVLSGDWNTHHGMWEVVVGRVEHRAEELAEWLVESDFTVLNEHNEPTYQSHDGRTLSVLDLTFANPKAIELDTVKEWAVIPEMSSGSDHYALHWTIDNGRALVDNLFSRKFNWDKADQEKFERILREEVLGSGAFDPLRLARLPSEEQMERAAEALEEALVKAAEQSVPLRRPSAKAQPWWEGEVLAVREVMTQARLAERQGREFVVDGQPLRANTAINHFKYKSKKAKQNYYKKVVAETTSQNIWDRHRWVKSIRQYLSPPIQRAGQDVAVEHSDKCDALRAELFPPPADLDVDPPDLSQPL
ncbi:MAG TPA: endonuclease/exonuclease/phosphatase family protein, partial [Ktedonobacteraceae bacterium]|nr:endonuclease/exonuclease/phosphatase family protein [Ktedonobacteraceae bacterium]